ncbi:MAG TPA: extracellular solute-binding protein [Bacteroidia bacterium]|nr:extracellular solute-binding protein [Bacteroidia bacterium]
MLNKFKKERGKKMKRGYVKLLALIMALVFLVGCGGSATTQSTSDATQTSGASSTEGTKTATETKSSKGRIIVTFWTANTGNLYEWKRQAADKFNQIQDKYFVDVSYQGSYNDILTKVRTSQKENLPDIVHTNGTGVASIAVTDKFIPIQDFVDRDNFDMSDIMVNLKANYTRNGRWICVPMGNTVVGFFYNEDMLKQVGIDPRNDLNSYEEILVAAEKLAKSGIVKYPFYYSRSSDFIVWSMVAEGLKYVDNNNGKDGVPTKCFFMEDPKVYDAVYTFFSFLKTMFMNGWAVPYDTNAASSRELFVNKEVAMILGYSSSTTTIGDMCDWSMNFGFHESPTIHKGVKSIGQAGGGGALFIANNGDEESANGAWEFIKFLLQPDQTAGFAMASGYLPTTQSGWDHTDYQKFVAEKFPTAVHLHEAQKNTSQECYAAQMPMFSQFDSEYNKITQRLCTEPDYTVEQAIKDLTDKTNEAIELYLLESKK